MKKYFFFVAIIIFVSTVSGFGQTTVTAPTAPVPMDVVVTTNGNDADKAILRSFAEEYILMLQGITEQNRRLNNPDPRLNLFPTSDEYELVSKVVSNGVRLKIDVQYTDPQDRGRAMINQLPISQKEFWLKTGGRIASKIGFDILGRWVNQDAVNAGREEVNRATEIPIPNIYFFQITISATTVSIVNGEETEGRKAALPRTYDYQVFRYDYEDQVRVFWVNNEISQLGYDSYKELKPSYYSIRANEAVLLQPLVKSGKIWDDPVIPLTMNDDTFHRSQVYGAAISLLREFRQNKIRPIR